MPRTNIYVSDSEHANLQQATANMKAAGTSLSAEILKGLKASKFWPKKPVRAAGKKR